MRKIIVLLLCTVLVCSFQHKSYAQTTVISHDFNSSNDGWSGGWVYGAGILDEGSDGLYWHTDAADYVNNASLTVTSPTISTSGFTSLVLKVDIRYDTEANYDGMQLEYNGGGGWNVLGAVGDGFNWFNETDLDAIASGEDGWSGDNLVWQTAVIPLPASLENNTNTQFRLTFASDFSNTDVGVAFDNFTIVSGGADIYIAGNGSEIEYGDFTPSNLDDTDFRSVGINFAGSKVKSFTVVNVAGGTLTLDASPVSISGIHASDFTVSVQPGDLSLIGGESTTFSIEFDPSAAGLREATVSVASDDADQDPYVFNIQGRGVDEEIYYSFDAGDEGWTVTSNTNGNWSRGTAMLSEGADGSFWHTTPVGTYNDLADLIIESGTIDLSGATNMILYLDIRYETEDSWDGMRMEYSSDDGSNWSSLGAISEGVNWYNNANVNVLGEDGWTGDNNRWQTAEIELPVALENNSTTKYRLIFQSGNGDVDTGVAFDNFMISIGVPEIYVEGNGIEIVNGAGITSNLIGTNFRNVDITSGAKSNTFTIYNTDGGTLNLTGTPIVEISGTDASDFTVTSQPASTALGFNESTTFTIEFDPTTTGEKNATVSIANDDSDEAPFTFAISGVADDAIVYHDFNSSDHGWTLTSNTNGDWLRGSSILATGADGSYWYTDPSNYSNSADITLTSPVIDLTGEMNLTLHLDLRYDTEANNDGFRVEYSDDNGSSWNLLGTEGSGINWYNDSDVDAFGDAEDGWSGDNTSWQTAEMDLPASMENNSQAVFRILFASDGATTDVGAAFDNFAIYADVTPVPVELISFTGSEHGEYVKLEWSTSSELNNDYFEIQKSKDGFEFEAIGKVSGNGTTNNEQIYQFDDSSPFSGLNYYRLVQFDYDGKREIHHTISVGFNELLGEGNILAYPNPVLQDRKLRLKLNGMDNDSIKIQIYSLMGNLVYNDIQLIEKHQNDISIDLAQFKTGIYSLSVDVPNQKYVTKLVVY